MEPVLIESLDQAGRGIAHIDGKTCFVDGALPGEQVTINVYRKKPNYQHAKMAELIRASSQRVTPLCPYFTLCGGCSMQHLQAQAQVAIKQRVLEDALWHIGKVKAQQILPAIYGEIWNYRYRARLAVRWVSKKGGTLVGFHEKKSSFITDMESCAVLPERIANLIAPLRRLIDQLSIRERLPQIEVACSEQSIVLVLRILQDMLESDSELIRQFAEDNQVHIYLQPQGTESVYPFHPSKPAQLSYRLSEYGLTYSFAATEFTQVNPNVNAILVRRAMQLLDPKRGERIADLFCGIGNFTLPIAALGATVVGIEGHPTLVARAYENAALNGLSDSTHFISADLFDTLPNDVMQVAKLLIDPPREGALNLIRNLPENIARLVYVSCNPATLARDAAVLIHEKNCRLVATGVVNMFPHTAHVESVALFERQ